MADLEKGVKVDKRLGFYDWAKFSLYLPLHLQYF
jgi:hypothetical protein